MSAQCQERTSPASFDHLVGGAKQRRMWRAVLALSELAALHPLVFQRLQIRDHIPDLPRIELKLRHRRMARHDAFGQGLGEVLDRIFGV